MLIEPHLRASDSQLRCVFDERQRLHLAVERLVVTHFQLSTIRYAGWKAQSSIVLCA